MFLTHLALESFLILAVKFPWPCLVFGCKALHLLPSHWLLDNDYFVFFASHIWFTSRSLGYFLSGSQSSMQCGGWAPFCGYGPQVSALIGWLLTKLLYHHVPQHIMQARYIVVRGGCDQMNVPVSLLGTLPIRSIARVSLIDSREFPVHYTSTWSTKKKMTGKSCFPLLAPNYAQAWTLLFQSLPALGPPTKSILFTLAGKFMHPTLSPPCYSAPSYLKDSCSTTFIDA